MTASEERECRTALRLAALALGDSPLSPEAYRSWRAGQVTPWPPATVICDVLGPWGEAVRHAGGTPPEAVDVLDLGDRPAGSASPPGRTSAPMPGPGRRVPRATAAP